MDNNFICSKCGHTASTSPAFCPMCGGKSTFVQATPAKQPSAMQTDEPLTIIVHKRKTSSIVFRVMACIFAAICFFATYHDVKGNYTYGAHASNDIVATGGTATDIGASLGEHTAEEGNTFYKIALNVKNEGSRADSYHSVYATYYCEADDYQYGLYKIDIEPEGDYSNAALMALREYCPAGRATVYYEYIEAPKSVQSFTANIRRYGSYGEANKEYTIIIDVK